MIGIKIAIAFTAIIFWATGTVVRHNDILSSYLNTCTPNRRILKTHHIFVDHRPDEIGYGGKY